MIESWVGGTARILPLALVGAGHRYTFVTRRREHYVESAGAPVHPVMAHAHRIIDAETNDTVALIEQLKQCHSEDAFDGALTICDYYLQTVAEVASALSIPHPFPGNLRLSRSKHRVRAALDAHAVPNPRYAVVSGLDQARQAAAGIGYPLVVKPTDLASSAYVQRVCDDSELIRAISALQGFERNFRDQPREQVCLLEEYLEGEEVSVETCTLEGETTLLGVTDKSVTGAPFFIEDGHMFPAELPADTRDQIEAFARSVLRAVGHDRGVAHIEVKLTAAGPRLIEINPRMPGNYIVELIQHVTGIDLLAVTTDLALGRTPQLEASERWARSGSAAIKFLIPPRAGSLREIRGAVALSEDPRVVRWHLASPGARIGEPVDNACYLGHVATLDRQGASARTIAEQLISKLEVIYAD